MLTSVVGAYKPALEEIFNTQADILTYDDKEIKPIVSQRSEPQPNRYNRTEEQGLRYNLTGEQACSVLLEPHNSTTYVHSYRYCKQGVSKNRSLNITHQTQLDHSLQGFYSIVCRVTVYC